MTQEPHKPATDGAEPEWYSFYTYSGFAFDPGKSSKNKAKHGTDFKQAQAAWKDENRVLLTAQYVEEARVAVIGRIGPNLWTVIHVLRDDTVRIISARRARHEEKEFYRNGLAPHDGGGV